MDPILELAQTGTDLSQLSDARSRYRFDRIFADSGWGSRRKAKLALLRKVDAELERALAPDEKVEHVTWGVEHSTWDLLTLGFWMAIFNRRALFFTDRRVLLFECRGTSKLKALRFQLRYEAVRKARTRFGGSLRLWFASGKAASWTQVPRRDRERAAMLLEGEGAVATGPQAKENLCTHCFAPQLGFPDACDRCGQRFKSPRRAMLLSFLFPGLGDLYIGHRLMGTFELLTAALVWLALILGVLDPEEGLSLGEALIILPIFMGLFHAIDAVHTLRLARKGLFPASGRREPALASAFVDPSNPTMPTLPSAHTLQRAARPGGLGNTIKWSGFALFVVATVAATQLLSLESSSLDGWEAGCESGDAKRCLQLGYLYRTGDGVAQDDARGASLYARACELGSAHGCRNLGYLYRNGLGVAVDLERARALYTSACENGDGGGCNNLGVMYRDGDGVAVDRSQARVHFDRGCALGSANACENHGGV